MLKFSWYESWIGVCWGLLCLLLTSLGLVTVLWFGIDLSSSFNSLSFVFMKQEKIGFWKKALCWSEPASLPTLKSVMLEKVKLSLSRLS